MIMGSHRKQKAYCDSCWRDEFFAPVELSAFAAGMLTVVTCGLTFRYWPCRCITCGKLQVKSISTAKMAHQAQGSPKSNFANGSEN